MTSRRYPRDPSDASYGVSWVIPGKVRRVRVGSVQAPARPPIFGAAQAYDRVLAVAKSLGLDARDIDGGVFERLVDDITSDARRRSERGESPRPGDYDAHIREALQLVARAGYGAPSPLGAGRGREVGQQRLPLTPPKPMPAGAGPRPSDDPAARASQLAARARELGGNDRRRLLNQAQQALDQARAVERAHATSARARRERAARDLARARADRERLEARVRQHADRGNRTMQMQASARVRDLNGQIQELEGEVQAATEEVERQEKEKAQLEQATRDLHEAASARAPEQPGTPARPPVQGLSIRNTWLGGRAEPRRPVGVMPGQGTLLTPADNVTTAVRHPLTNDDCVRLIRDCARKLGAESQPGSARSTLAGLTLALADAAQARGPCPPCPCPCPEDEPGGGGGDPQAEPGPRKDQSAGDEPEPAQNSGGAGGSGGGGEPPPDDWMPDDGSTQERAGPLEELEEPAVVEAPPAEAPSSDEPAREKLRYQRELVLRNLWRERGRWYTAPPDTDLSDHEVYERELDRVLHPQPPSLAAPTQLRELTEWERVRSLDATGRLKAAFERVMTFDTIGSELRAMLEGLLTPQGLAVVLFASLMMGVLTAAGPGAALLGGLMFAFGFPVVDLFQGLYGTINAESEADWNEGVDELAHGVVGLGLALPSLFGLIAAGKAIGGHPTGVGTPARPRPSTGARAVPNPPARPGSSGPTPATPRPHGAAGPEPVATPVARRSGGYRSSVEERRALRRQPRPAPERELVAVGAAAEAESRIGTTTRASHGTPPRSSDHQPGLAGGGEGGGSGGRRGTGGGPSSGGTGEPPRTPRPTTGPQPPSESHPSASGVDIEPGPFNPPPGRGRTRADFQPLDAPNQPRTTVGSPSQEGRAHVRAVTHRAIDEAKAQTASQTRRPRGGRTVRSRDVADNPPTRRPGSVASAVRTAAGHAEGKAAAAMHPTQPGARPVRRAVVDINHSAICPHCWRGLSWLIPFGSALMVRLRDSSGRIRTFRFDGGFEGVWELVDGRWVPVEVYPF